MEGVYIFENHGYLDWEERDLFKKGIIYDGFICYFRAGDYKVSKFTACTWPHVRKRAEALDCADPDNIMVIACPEPDWDRRERDKGPGVCG